MIITTSSSLHVGVIITNDHSGFYLVHSKPNWPNSRIDGATSFPDTTYAQSLMCVTLNSSEFEKIASIQMINYPYIYDKYISTNLQSLLPTLNQWINKGDDKVVYLLSPTYLYRHSYHHHRDHHHTHHTHTHHRHHHYHYHHNHYHHHRYHYHHYHYHHHRYHH